MPTEATSESFDSRLKSVADAIETTLEGLLAPAALPGEVVRPARLLDAMRYSTLGGGKRLRPFLVVETARLFGVEGEGPLRAGAALEMIHCYSLVHDDLPAMDDDDLRRGRPTAHKAYDEATAILSGDALLTYAFDVMAGEATHADAGVRAALVLGLARASGLGGMVGGQALDLEAERATAPHEADFVMRMQAMKTGALLLFGVEAGAILGQASPAERAALKRYGVALGAAFQVADDILDTESDAATLGKAAGKDADRNKATLVAALGLDAAKGRRDALAEDAVAALDAFPAARSALLAEAARFTAQRRS
ncbi:polyprenyl synthetase family protein [Lichenibacterium ramalinae]|uniref:Probable farnesyl diphosphate synthase n=1 Tax=Lichenibacterium ramalinae TaxID=2316527 RepID=A0A4Q2RHL4_9HYPH|nr:farnesyl diphosphate synthase [Lichenibacterium ramalinae]RYB07214.1 polyprenyl synthetase family protein [Lichenibacterium ramalinae]